MSGERLHVRGITMRFGGVKALEDVSFVARAQEVLGILGPNGAGKTTLFNVISGLQKPTAGEVRFGDVRLTGRSLSRIAALGVTRTFQTPVMFWGLTVRESIAVALGAGTAPGTYPASAFRHLIPSGLRLGSQRRADDAFSERAGELLRDTPLEPLAERATESLSFGEERFLEIVRALAARPKVLLLDEPLSGLNAAEAQAVLTLVRAARDTGVAVLLVEHAVSELLSVADRVVVLDYGKKIAEGTGPEVSADPVVVEAYLGDEVA